MLRLFRRNREQDREKTQKAVRRSRESWFGRVMDALKSHQLDDATWDELEETLISADMGVETSLDMIARLKTRAREERLDQPAQIVDALRQELLSVLESGNGESGPGDSGGIQGTGNQGTASVHPARPRTSPLLL